MIRPRGRPRRDTPSPSRGEIVLASLRLLDAEGVAAFTMRALAERLQINPMTIYHHFGDRDGLIEAMSDQVYGEVVAPEQGDAFNRIGALLRAYHARVRLHPGLSLLIFSRPAIFPRQAKRITEQITRLLIEAGIPAERTNLWVTILVDFTHGAGLATAMSERAELVGKGPDDDYAHALNELLLRLRPGT